LQSPSSAFDHGRFSPGTLLGDRYRIVGLLGRGGMGEVYRADDLQLGQPVALKFLPEDVERDPARLERFVAEVRTARQISHPNVCRVYDIGAFEGRRFLSMEYIDGEDLRSLLRRIGRLPEDKGLQIARQVCAGLAAMHDRGVLHRDLKPANVMLDGAGRARLTDFGLATAVTGHASREIAGTPAYMAPEQLAGEALSAQTDLYALGLLLHELFTGERVHKTDKPAELRELHQAPRPAPLTKSSGAHLDPAIEKVIAHCLERDPSKRPAGAIAVAAALPGGDPLAAALAAGETPSPQMVAAAGEQGALSPKVGIPLLVALVLLTGVVVWLNGRQLYTAIVPFPHSSEVLATKAREMLGRLGYQESPADSGFGFDMDFFTYSTWLEKRDTSRNRWQRLASVRPPPARFWYRTSPELLYPRNYFFGGTAVLTPTDPPLTSPGMTYIELDFGGRLVALRAVLPEKEAPAPPAPSPDWSKLFTEAGLDGGAFRSVAPEWTAPAGADARAAWVGPGADARGAELRVEAASHRGRPVFFKFVAPWTEPAGATPRADGPPWFLVIFPVGILGLAIFLASRNARTGRADTRGATRLAVAISLIVLTRGLPTSRLAFSYDAAIGTLLMLTSWAAFMGLLMWMFYVALEPYARRRWPQMLISWSRLLDGRWRDPLIGRDLLVGSVIGMATGLPFAIYALLTASPAAPNYAPDAWMGLGHSFARLLQVLPASLRLTFFLLLLLVGLRIVLRTERLAMIALVSIFFAIGALTGDSAVEIALGVIFATTMVLVATRFGLMALLTMMGLGQLVSWSGASLTPPAPLVGATVLAIIAMLAPGVFGFYTSRARRSPASATWLDE
jgi:serine/threonine-protein kinase